MLISEKKEENYNIYIGLNDKNTLSQRFEVDDFLTIIKGACENYKMNFSLYPVEGGYFDGKGNFVKEYTIVLNVCGINKEQALTIASDLCYFFNQECVRVTKNIVEVSLVN